MEYQQDNNAVKLKSIIYTCVLFVPHYITLIAVLFFRFCRSVNNFFEDNRWVFLALVIIFPIGLFAIAACLSFIVIAIPPLALFDLYLLNYFYSQHSFLEASRIVFVEIFNENSDMFKSESVWPTTDKEFMEQY